MSESTYIAYSMRALIAIILQINLEARRQRSLYLAFGIGLLGLGSGWFIEQLALTEHQAILVSIAAPLIRLMTILMVLFYVCEQVHTERQQHAHWMILSQALSRFTWFWGRQLGFALVACVFAILSALPLWLAVPSQNLILWQFSLCLEVALFALITGVICTFMQSTLWSLAAGLGLYCLGRMGDTLLRLLDAQSTQASINFGDASWLGHTLLSIVPNFSAFANSAWLLNAHESESFFSLCQSWLQPAFIQVLIYAGILHLVVLIDLKRRDL
jgi:hypothetical protein